MLDVSGMAVAIQGPAREFVALAKQHGVREVFCATRSPAMRMLGVALGLATGVRMHVFPTVEEAWAGARAAAQRRD